MSTRVYEYGALAPVFNLDIVQDQMQKAHKYRNTLTEIERDRREKIREALLSHADTVSLAAEVETLDSEVKGLYELVGKLRSKHAYALKKTGAKGKAEIPEDLRVCVKEKKDLLKSKRAELREAKNKLKQDAEVQQRLAQINEDNAEKKRQARAVCEVYWGTYLPVEAAAEQAAKTSNVEPKFVRWTGTGHVAVQISAANGVEPFKTTDLFEKNRRVWIEPVDPKAWEKGQPGRRLAARTTLHLRVQSDGREPVWAVIPIIMHRPLPPGVVKWVHLFRKPLANKMHWKVQIVVAAPDAPPTKANEIAGVDVGWRMLPGGALRVAVLIDDKNHVEELQIPASLISKFRHPDDIRAVRDKLLDEQKPSVIEWLKTSPEGVDVQWNHVNMWRAPGRLIRLRKTYADLMPQALKDQLENYRKRDLHLWQWEVRERRKADFKRRELFRLWAAKLAQKYKVVGFEDFDLRSFSTAPSKEDGPQSEGRQHRGVRAIANVSELRNIVRSTMERNGGRVVEVAAENTTTHCAFCGHQNEWDDEERTALQLTCAGCDRTWDQDENGARNILARAFVAAAEAEALEASKSQDVKKVTTWQARKNKKKEKLSEGARNGPVNPSPVE